MVVGDLYKIFKKQTEEEKNVLISILSLLKTWILDYYYRRQDTLTFITSIQSNQPPKGQGEKGN